MRGRGLTRIALLISVGLAATPAPAAASVFAGHSGWFWASPLPQGNTLRALDFADRRGYAVGDFGTVMRSDDGGTTWSGITTGTTARLRVVRALGPDAVIVAGECTVRRSDDGGRSFRTLPWTIAGRTCRAGVTSLAFPTSESGYLLLSDGNLLHTADGGMTWVRRTAVPTTRATSAASTIRPTDVFFPARDTGFATTDAGVVFRTTDGGTSWTPVATAPQHLDSVYFVDTLHGFAAGGASVLSTTDGGNSWRQQGIVTPPASVSWIRCGTKLACIAATKRGEELVRTDDGGTTWTPISPSTRPLYAAAYSGAGGVVAVGEDGATVFSADGGHNFTTISGELDGAFTLMRAASSSTAFAAGRSGAIARTSDGGHAWELLAPPGAGDVVDLSFPDSDTGFALSAQNVLTRTSDGGRTWRLLDTGTFLRPRAVLAPDASHVVLVMERGLRRSADGGLAFARVRRQPMASAAFSGGGTAANGVYAFGGRILAFSRDRGSSWTALRRPPGAPLRAVDFTSASVAYALTRDGRLWKTVDGAGSWRELTGLGTQIGTAVAFGDADNGYVAVPQFGHDDGGYLMRTTDGGASWRPQLVDSNPIRARALAASGSDSAFAVAGGRHLLATDRGGDIGQRSLLTLTVKRQRPGRAGVIAVTGTLTPAEGGETVVVSKREGRSRRWLFRHVTVSSSGHYTVFTSITKTTSFVAQWSGDDEHAGAGTRVVVVRVAPPAKPRGPRP